MSDTRPAFDEERLPWLEEVEDEDGPRGVPARKMLGALLVVLIATAVVAGTFFWLGHHEIDTNGAPELIRAPTTPYKVKPANPGGLDVAGESETTFETSAGKEVQGQLDTTKLPETQALTPPVPQSQSKRQPQPKTLPHNETKEPLTAGPAEAAPVVGSGSVVQLGAFKNTAQAERAWLALSARFPQLSGVTKMVVPYSAGGSSGYRLRAAASSPAAAKALCGALQAGGESCFIAE